MRTRPSPKKQKQTMKKKPKKTRAYPGDHVEKIKVDELNRALVTYVIQGTTHNKQANKKFVKCVSVFNPNTNLAPKK